MTKASRKVTREYLRAQKKSSSAGWWVVGIVGAIMLVTAFLVLYLPSRPVATLEGVQTYANLARDHSELPQVYAQTPPVGGVHSSAWQNCGVYDQPVKNENAVHSLEHGAVWITYQPDLPQATVDQLRNLARGHDHVLLTPYPGLPRPVVASAWGLQLPLDDANDQRLTLFISRYESGPQTPEPGAVCSGGVGTPIS
ncbi:MAG TPA: DUF3105 domain-containing protein [Anaerolineae bacterium]|nr:DUF3105 domain-containing protein [Anaerolineae bacterium]